jgi:parallel beta-helix repeat protein
MECYIDGVNVFDAGDPAASEGGIVVGAKRTLIRGNHVTRWWKGIYAAAPDVTIEDNMITSIGVSSDDGNGIELYNPTAPYVPRAIVRGNHIIDVYWEGIQVGIGSDGSIIEGNVILNTGPTGSTSAGLLVSANDIVVRGNVVRGFKVGIYCEMPDGSLLSSKRLICVQNNIGGLTATPAYAIWTNDAAPIISDNIISGGSLRSEFGHGARITSNQISGAPIQIVDSNDVVVAGNTVDGAPNDGMANGGSCSRFTVTGNSMKNCGWAGMYINSLDHAIVSHNTCINNGRSDGGKGGIQLWQTTRTLVTENVCTDSGTGAAKKQAYGVLAFGGGTGCDFNVYIGNMLSGNTTTGLVRSGANDVTDDNLQ